MKVFYLAGVFMGGFLSALNLLALNYPDNMPEHIVGSWAELSFAVFFAVVFGLTSTKT